MFLSLSVLKTPMIFQHLRQGLRRIGIRVREADFTSLLAIAEALYANRGDSLRGVRDQITNFRRSRGISIDNRRANNPNSSSFSNPGTPTSRPGLSGERISSRNVDSASGHFTEERQFSGIPVKSPCLPKAHRASDIL